jgi:hypothetical protein
LNRVPEFPYAHDGVSMRWPRSTARTVSAVVILGSLPPEQSNETFQSVRTSYGDNLWMSMHPSLLEGFIK